MDKKITKSSSKDFGAEEVTDDEEYQDGEEEEDEEEEVKDDSAVSSECLEDEEEEYEEFTKMTIYRPKLYTRRAVAEDLKYNLTYIKPFRNRTLDSIAKSFESEPINLEEMSEEDRKYIIDRLSLDLPLDLAANKITCERYWERRSKQLLGHKFKYVDMSDYEIGFKQLFFETYLQNKMTSFVPNRDDFQNLIDICSIGGSYVRKLYLHQLLIPVEIHSTTDTNNFEEHLMKETPTGHLNLGVMGKCFPFLEDLEIRYCVENCGLNFEWGMFYCTTWDVRALCTMLLDLPEIKKLAVNHSRVDNVKVEIFANILPRFENLNHLSLAHNAISDDGARFLAKYLHTDPPLTILDLSDNNVGLEGAMSIFYSLMTNTSLLTLQLQINPIGPKISAMLTRSLVTNNWLRKLSLAATGLNDEFLVNFSKSLENYNNLTKLDISANPGITEVGATALLRGLLKNDVMLAVDMENGNDFGDVAQCIQHRIESNKTKKNKSIKRVFNKMRNIYKMRQVNSKFAFSSGSDNRMRISKFLQD